jgi:hypothetical protein
MCPDKAVGHPGQIQQVDLNRNHQINTYEKRHFISGSSEAGLYLNALSANITNNLSCT